MGWSLFRGVWFEDKWDRVIPCKEYSLRDDPVRSERADRFIPVGTPSCAVFVLLPELELRSSSSSVFCPGEAANLMTAPR